MALQPSSRGAAQAVMRDPELAQVAMTAARQGLIKLACKELN